MRARFFPAASAELFEAADYYAKRRPSLGDEFLDEAMRIVNLIKEAPLRLAPRRHGERKWGMDRFPYAMVYVMRGDDIVIVAVAHWKRRPHYWRHRMTAA